MDQYPTVTLELVDSTDEMAEALANLINRALQWRNAPIEEKILAECELAIAVDDITREFRKTLPGMN